MPEDRNSPSSRPRLDFSEARFRPVLHAVIYSDSRILLVRRSAGMASNPHRWGGVSGYLDGKEQLISQALRECAEEISMPPTAVSSAYLGRPFVNDDPRNDVTWVAFPLLLMCDPFDPVLNAEADAVRWAVPTNLPRLHYVPGFHEIVRRLDVLSMSLPIVELEEGAPAFRGEALGLLQLHVESRS